MIARTQADSSPRVALLELRAPVVVALPRGGVPIGVEVAHALHAPLDVLAVRKIGAPIQPELGIGAIAEGGVLVARDDVIQMLRIDDDELERLRQVEEVELERRRQQYRHGRPLVSVEGRDVVIVDDGLATGVTAEAAIASIRRCRPRSLVLAAPVTAPDTARRLAPEVDALVDVGRPFGFGAVGAYYDDFDQVTDAEVEEMLAAFVGHGD